MFEETRHVRPAVMPVVQLPNGDYMADSTPILLEIEKDRPSERSILPDDPGHAFLARIIEDMADEWLTKALFYQRFAYETDGLFASRWVMSDTSEPDETSKVEQAAATFRKRQVERMPLVGCTPNNGPIIEASYRRLLAAMEGFVGNECFLFGSRPSLADFGLYGQLKTLATDPTALSVMRGKAPFTEYWVRRVDDLSGVDGTWSDTPVAAIDDLLRIAGDTYLPFLRANAAAIANGKPMVRVRLLDHDYEQPSFRYQVKCLQWLREAFAALPADAVAAIRPRLEATGCWSTFEAA